MSHEKDRKDIHDIHDTRNVHSDDTLESRPELQAGVARVEGIAKTWTSTSLFIAYVGIFLMALIYGIELTTTSQLAPYATDSYNDVAALATVGVVRSILTTVVKPPMAKISDVFGRFEAFVISILFYTLGFIQIAASKNLATYISAFIFYAAGQTGVQILQQIFIADTTDLRWRALMSSLPDIPFLFTVWAGPEIVNLIYTKSTWRWGYGMWAIILPICSIPLLASLLLNQLKAARLGLAPRYFSALRFNGSGSFKHKLGTIGSGLKRTFWELDIMGILLFGGGLAMLLVPVSLTAPPPSPFGYTWGQGGIIAIIVIGAILFVSFIFFESSRKLAPFPLVSLRLLKDRTVWAGCLVGFFYFWAYYMSLLPYFYPYLVVVRNESIVEAGNILRIFNFASVSSSIGVSLVIRFTKRYKYAMVFGAALYLVGMGLCFRYRSIDSSRVAVYASQVLIGLGGGCLNVPAQLGVQASASHQELSASTALFLTITSLGGAFGNAISGAIWRALIPRKLNQYLPVESRGDIPNLVGSFLLASAYPIGSPDRIAIQRAYDETMRVLLSCAVVMASLTLFFTLLMRNYHLDKMDQGVAGLVIGNKHAETTPIDPHGDEIKSAVDGARSNATSHNNASHNNAYNEMR